MAAVAGGIGLVASSVGITIATAGASSGQTLSAHIYVCQTYTTSKGIPSLEVSTTEATGGEISATAAGVTTQSNPLTGKAVSAGTYSVTATAPAGYYFTDCPSEATTPTLSNEDKTATESVSVSSGGSGVAKFYVVAFSSATCKAVVGGVQCTLPDALGLPFFNLSTLLTEAKTVASTLTTSTPIAITAIGGGGGTGAKDPGTNSSYVGGTGGTGGRARTATTIADYYGTYKTTLLFYYLGYEGIGNGNYGDSVGGLGGASTIVSAASLSSTDPCIATHTSCSTTNVLLIAAGGGGGGQGGVSSSGGKGGSGATTVATTSSNATGTGGGGTRGGGSGGHGGGGGGTDNGGGGGSGGGGATGHSGGSGVSSIGGLGGPVHTKSGASKSIPWENVGYLTSTVNTHGQGGEGEWRGTGLDDGGGGGGGGGFGGGGGGGGGGATYSGGGAGAGGNFALKAATTTESFTVPAQTRGYGAVYVTFVIS